MASTWAGLATNQTVSFTNLQNAVTTGYFYAIATITPSSEQITKADASSLVSIDTAYAPFAAKTSNQLVVKSDLKPIFQFSGTFYYSSTLKVSWEGWASANIACASYGTPNTTAYWNGTFAVGTELFLANTLFDDYFIIVISGVAYAITLTYSFYDSVLGLYAHTVDTIDTCVLSDSWSVRTEGGSTPINICTNTPFTVYSAVGAVFTSGTALYSDAALTTSLFIGGSPNSYISEVLSGTIFEYNDGLGQIGTNTGSTC